MVTHIVLFRFQNQSDAEESKRRLLSMAGRVAGLREIEVGLDFTKGARSFDLGLVTRHDDRAGLEAYRTDPVHQEVAAFISERNTEAAAVDFESSH